MNTTMKMALAGLGLVVALGTAGAASADTNWQKHHPRREEVNARLIRQGHRITGERREGEMGAHKAHVLRMDDHRIRGQERFDARHDHGHITKREQRHLNHEENAVSRQIGR